MMQNPKISKMNHLMMTQLANVYSDPPKVSRDSSSLLASLEGYNLDPVVSQIYENDGSASPPILMFNGTIAMPYRGVTYNIPVNIYLPPNYPARPPVAYVRPTSTMMVKKGHPHVAQADGKIYMPYLHQWTPRFNLNDLIINMSSVFSADPPVVSKPVQPPSYFAATTYTQPAQTQPPQQQHQPTYQSQQSAEEIRLAQEISQREEEERKKREEEMQKKKMQAYQDQVLNEKKTEINTKISSSLHFHENSAKTEIYTCLYDMARMKRAEDTTLSDDHPDSQFKLLRDQKQKLENYNEQLDIQTEQLRDFVEKLKSQKEGSSGMDYKNPESVDSIAVPDNIHSRQMLELCAENAAISDLMYFLDKALARGTIPLDVHLKQIRRLAKKQFLVKAHLLKVGQVVSKEHSQRKLI